MLRMKFRLTILLFLFTQTLQAQDSLLARRMVDTLTSPYFWGRGYTNDGMGKAARFIAAQFKSFGLQPLTDKNYIQGFSFDANTFPGKMEVAVNGVALIPGRDFIVGPESIGIKGEFKLVQKDSASFINAEAHILVTLENKLTWSVEQKATDYTAIQLDKKAIKQLPSAISINIENVLVKNFKADNICAMIKGTERPDSLILLTGHYDHLGGMGSNTYFPGANDNASGISMLLTLAKYYAAHPQRYTIVFICFAGEEAGLLGSKYFTENPLVPLDHIRFLVNMDMVGTGEEGITAVNATIYPKEFALMKQVNDRGHYLVKIASRGKAANSDHYWFTEKNVPAFFIYTMGGLRAYHNIFDISKTLPLNEYNHLFKLLVGFNAALMK